MNAPETAAAVRPAIVAMIPKYGPPGEGANLPPILGTGVIVGDGLVLTNEHVVEALLKWRWRDPNDKGWPFVAVLLHSLPEGLKEKAFGGGYAEIPLEVLGVFHLKDLELKETDFYYGPRRPDFAVVHVKCGGLPSVEFLQNVDHIQAGMDVMSMGFPMGTDALTAPGWVHQLSPMLQQGIVSSVLPFPCPNPLGFVTDIPALGGASGSPVFLGADPRPIGLLYAGLTQPTSGPVFAAKQVVGKALINVPTAFSYVVPGHLIAAAINMIKEDGRFALPADAPTLTAILERATYRPKIRSGEHGDTRPRENILLKAPGAIEVGAFSVSAVSIDVPTEPSSAAGDDPEQ